MANQIMITTDIESSLRFLLGEDAEFILLVMNIRRTRVEYNKIGLSRESSILIAGDLLGLSSDETTAILSRVDTKLGAK